MDHHILRLVDHLVAVLAVDILGGRPVDRLVEDSLDLEVGPKQRNRVSEMHMEILSD